MRKYFFISFIIAGFSCKNNAHKGPIISYKANVQNLGNISFKNSYTGRFLVANIGDRNLEIVNTTADCSCTVTEIEKKTIEPGDSAYIRYSLTPAVDGYLQQDIFVDNNSVNESRVLFLIRAFVKLQ
jgi:Protein of unknown function (DUF1573)